MTDTDGESRELIREGATVFAGSTPIGTVSGFISRSGEDFTELLVTSGETGEETIVPLSDLDPDRSTSDALWLLEPESPESIPGTAVMPLAEEQLDIRIRERDRGTVRIRKNVEVTPVHEIVDIRRDEVIVEQRQVDEPAESLQAPWYEGDTLVVPVYEEIVVTEKRLMLREELRVTRRSVTEQVEIDETIRHDRIEFEKVDPSEAND